jgi:hypothetical protein
MTLPITLCSLANNLITRRHVTSNCYQAVGPSSVWVTLKRVSACSKSNVWSCVCVSLIYLEHFVLLRISEAPFFSHFFKLKIRVRLKFEEIFSTLLQTRKHRFPRTTSRLANRVVNFTGSEMCFFKNPIFMKIPF